MWVREMTTKTKGLPRRQNSHRADQATGLREFVRRAMKQVPGAVADTSDSFRGTVAISSVSKVLPYKLEYLPCLLAFGRLGRDRLTGQVIAAFRSCGDLRWVCVSTSRSDSNARPWWVFYFSVSTGEGSYRLTIGNAPPVSRV